MGQEIDLKYGSKGGLGGGILGGVRSTILSHQV